MKNWKALEDPSGFRTNSSEEQVFIHHYDNHDNHITVPPLKNRTEYYDKVISSSELLYVCTFVHMSIYSYGYPYNGVTTILVNLFEKLFSMSTLDQTVFFSTRKTLYKFAQWRDSIYVSSFITHSTNFAC